MAWTFARATARVAPTIHEAALRAAFRGKGWADMAWTFARATARVAPTIKEAALRAPLRWKGWGEILGAARAGAPETPPH